MISKQCRYMVRKKIYFLQLPTVDDRISITITGTEYSLCKAVWDLMLLYNRLFFRIFVALPLHWINLAVFYPCWISLYFNFQKKKAYVLKFKFTACVNYSVWIEFFNSCEIAWFLSTDSVYKKIWIYQSRAAWIFKIFGMIKSKKRKQPSYFTDTNINMK